jgi:hypothetical protein
MKMVAFGQVFSRQGDSRAAKFDRKYAIKEVRRGDGLTLFPLEHMKKDISKQNVNREESRAPGGKARPDTDVRRLESEPQRELDFARKIVLAGYLTK